MMADFLTAHELIMQAKNLHNIPIPTPRPEIIETGVSYMSAILSSIISALVGAGIGSGLGWYIRGRGVEGVQIDLSNVKKTLQDVESKLAHPAS